MNNRLMKLLRDNAKAEVKRPLNVVLPKAEDVSPEATIYLYDVIVADEWEAEWWGGVAPMGFIRALEEASLAADTVHLRFNCPGGDVFAARVMESAIRRCPKRVMAHVDGYAASAASYLALACDEVEIAQGGFFMIHRAWTLAWGNEEDLTSAASLLRKIDTSLVDTYVAETGLGAKKIEDMMAAETWISSKEAVDLGFADRIAEDSPKASASWNLNAYANAPKAEQTDTEPKPAAAPAPEPTPELTPKPSATQEDIPSGEPEPCTSGESVGLNQTQASQTARPENIENRLAWCECVGRKRVPARP